jgi:hypothetical protein
LRATETYLPYFAIRARYDNARARAALAPAIAPAPLPEYFDALVDYALRAGWGATSPARVASAAAPGPARGTPTYTAQNELSRRYRRL